MGPRRNMEIRFIQVPRTGKRIHLFPSVTAVWSCPAEDGEDVSADSNQRIKQVPPDDEEAGGEERIVERSEGGTGFILRFQRIIIFRQSWCPFRQDFPRLNEAGNLR
jgi:hypothetical protein